jgi:hypothetical protein
MGMPDCVKFPSIVYLRAILYYTMVSRNDLISENYAFSMSVKIKVVISAHYKPRKYLPARLHFRISAGSFWKITYTATDYKLSAHGFRFQPYS